MGRISSGISQIGGKFRLLKEILELIPYHEFYLEPFLGSAIVLINKPRCRYECGNDINSELINYLLVISGFEVGIPEFTINPNKFEYNEQIPKMLDEMKQSVLGLVSQEICNRIVRGELQPRNNIERAYFFYYLNKLTFGGSVNKELVREGGYGNKIAKFATSETCDEIKAQYSGMLNNFALGTIKEKEVNEAKANYRGLSGPHPLCTVGKENQIQKIKAIYRGISPKKKIEKTKQQYHLSGGKHGIVSAQQGGFANRNTDIEKAKKQYKNAQIKGINPKTTRPYTNNDCGLLSPLNPKAIDRLRFINLTCYPFDKVYKMFYDAFHVRKGLGKECFCYFDPPYPGTERYYRSGFGLEDHYKLIDILLESPFHVLLSIGGNCEFYLDAFEWDNRSLWAKNNWRIVPVNVKYSTDANSQKDSREYLIMNYNISKLPKMKFESVQNTLEAFV